MKSTPSFGPWHIGGGFGDTLFIRKEQPDGRGEVVAMVHLFRDVYEELPDGSKLIRKVPIPHAREKAALIAAAPKLLEALQAMLRVSILTESEPGYSISEAEAMARAALAQATVA